MNYRHLYQDIIIDHGRTPRNFGADPQANRIKEGDNPLCGDQLILYVVESEGVVKKVSFEGSGCAVSMASASLMTEAVKGKTVEEVKTLFDAFHAMVTQGLSDQDLKDNPSNLSDSPANLDNRLGKLQALAGITQYPMRVKCATLAWHTLLGAFQGGAEKVTTEQDTGHLNGVTTSDNDTQHSLPKTGKPLALITLTASATEHIKRLLAAKTGAIGFRLSVKKSGCSGYMYVPEIIEKSVAGDVHFVTSEGVPVFVDARYADMLKNTVVDFVMKNAGQKQIVFNNPNATQSCGCGESFTLED